MMLFVTLRGFHHRHKSMYWHVSSKYRVSLTTIWRWYSHYLIWGEYKHLTTEKVKRFNKKFKMFCCTNIITDEIVSTLQTIVDTNPEYYIDEIAEELVKHTGVYLPFTIIYTTLKEKLNYLLQVCYESAKQRNELERKRYKAALKSIVKNAGQVLVIDEAHKDKRASRRRRAWGRRNSGGIALKKWFRNEKRYTMIAGFGINGFEKK